MRRYGASWVCVGGGAFPPHPCVASGEGELLRAGLFLARSRTCRRGWRWFAVFSPNTEHFLDSHVLCLGVSSRMVVPCGLHPVAQGDAH